MRPFSYSKAKTLAEASFQAREPATMAAKQFLAGGTTLIDLMKLDVMQPGALIDIKPLKDLRHITASGDGLFLGALVRMSEAADHAEILKAYPVVAHSLQQAASQQIRNMATLGGNVLQRTRCPYFRETSFAACNKRKPGSGCSALDGVNRKHAVLGVSDSCIATYPGDFAQALVALGGSVEVLTKGKRQRIAFEELHRAPGETPHIETVLDPGDLITGFFIPAGPWTRRSLYVKVRDRESYEFALASAAVALDLRDGTVHEARIGLGGVATKPWRAHEAEKLLMGATLDEQLARKAAEAAFAGAKTQEQNAYKVELGRRTMVDALLRASKLEVPA
jgi:xanthine dehydrogenase YagS FAD-binding subunit